MKSKEISKLNTLLKRICQGFTPPENITVSEWADRYRILSSENSAEAGRWRTARTPYLKEIMDSFTDPKVKKIVVVASAQVGKTEMLINILAYIIDQDPGSIMFAQPTKDMTEEFSKRRLAPMLRDTIKISSKVADSKSRDSKNTIRQKIFRGGMLTMVGSNSPTDLASTPARYVLGDEIDRWAKDAGGEGDPTELLEARTSNFYNSKIVQVSTPTVKGRSSIAKEFDKGTKEYWSVECPHCKEYSFVRFENIRYKHHEIGKGRNRQYIVDEVSWACPFCGCLSDEYTVKHQPKKWIAQSPEAKANGIRSFWINGFYSPWTPWEKIITKFLQAGKDPMKLQPVFNTLFGELWEESETLQDEDELIERAEEYGAEIPDGVLCLTCGVDTQGDRLEYEVVGYGFGGENWGIERGILLGDPSTLTPWEKLDGILNKKWRFASGHELGISLTFVDSGGNKTQSVYEQCAQRRLKQVYAIKGRAGANIPYTSPGKNIKYNNNGRTGIAKLFTIGVDEGKANIFSGLLVTEDGARKSHFPVYSIENGYDTNFYTGLLSEHVVIQANGMPKWVKFEEHGRNEPLDCRNYANAAFSMLKPDLEKIAKRLSEPVKKEKKKITIPKKSRARIKRDYYDGEW